MFLFFHSIPINSVHFGSLLIHKSFINQLTFCSAINPSATIPKALLNIDARPAPCVGITVIANSQHTHARTHTHTRSLLPKTINRIILKKNCCCCSYAPCHPVFKSLIKGFKSLTKGFKSLTKGFFVSSTLQ